MQNLPCIQILPYLTWQGGGIVCSSRTLFFTFPPLPKKMKGPFSVVEVRRSNKIANLNVGFRYKAQSDVAGKTGKKNKSSVAMNFGPVFEAQLINEKTNSPTQSA